MTSVFYFIARHPFPDEVAPADRDERGDLPSDLPVDLFVNAHLLPWSISPNDRRVQVYAVEWTNDAYFSHAFRDLASAKKAFNLIVERVPDIFIATVYQDYDDFYEEAFEYASKNKEEKSVSKHRPPKEAMKEAELEAAMRRLDAANRAADKAIARATLFAQKIQRGEA